LADEAKGVKEDAKKIAAAVAGENWDEEFEFAKKAHVDIVELERGAADLEKDLRNPSTKYTQQERIVREKERVWLLWFGFLTKSGFRIWKTR
jgi:glycerol-3-phosphate cytidylyltransferase-like family protein